MKTLASIFLAVLIASLCSCGGSKAIFEKNVSIPNEKWDKNNIVHVDVPITDTLSIYDIFINLRNLNSYPYNNLYLFVTINTPSGQRATDTVEYRLADVYGKWLGKSSSRIWDCKLPFRYYARFADTGTYVFDIRHGMRHDVLEGISDVGLSVEPTSQQKQ